MVLGIALRRCSISRLADRVDRDGQISVQEVQSSASIRVLLTSVLLSLFFLLLFSSFPIWIYSFCIALS